MDYQLSQNLVNDLLGDGSNFDLSDLNTGLAQGGHSEHANDLNAPGLWSDSDSEVSGSEDDATTQARQHDLAQLKEDVRGAVRFRSRKAKKMPRKGRQAPETLPTFEVQGMLGRANQKFVEHDLDEAQKILEEIIRIDYNVFAAWQTLAEVHKDRGNMDKCLTALMTAAHLRPKDSDIWASVAALSVASGLIDQADYCYNKLCQALPQNVDVIWDRAILNKDNARSKKAIDCFRQILKLIPFEMTTVRELARLYLEQARVEEAISLYDATSNYYMSGQARDVFDWSELNIMAELYIAAADTGGRSELWRVLINRIKTVARWLRGRQFETWWNDHNEDAEWDHDNSRRKLEPRFIASTNADAFALPLELRVKLGKARLVLRDKAEAMRHFDFLEGEHPPDMSDLFLEVGDALLKAECWDEALEFYSKVVEVEETNGPELWSSMAKAFLATEEFDQAEECLDAVLASDPLDSDTMVLLAELYERTDRRQSALETINRVIELRRPPDEGDTDTTTDDFFSVIGEEDTTFFETDRAAALKEASKSKVRRKRGNKSSARKKEDLVEYEKRKTEDTRNKFKALELASDGMLKGDFEATDQWRSSASDLIDDFRNIRHFYPSERKHTFQGIIRPKKGSKQSALSLADQLQGMADRLEESITAGQAVSKTISQLDEFRGFNFSIWLEVFLQYALLLIQSGDREEAYATLDAAAAANVFYHENDRLMRIQVTKMLLSIVAKDAKTGADQARWLMLHCLFRDDALRFYSTALSSGLLSQATYNDNPNQKFMLRMVKTMDSLLNNSSIAGTISVKELDQSKESVRPETVHPILLMLYGHIVASGKGYIASLQYFSRAYASTPTDPFVLFSIGLAYLHRSMQRQSDNRHLQIVQAFSFLLNYRDSRIASENPGRVQEAEYNIGRALHQLGLLHLALPYYERALSVRGVDAKYDLTQSAAYNVQLIYVMSGNPGKARDIVEEYLTI